MRPRSHLVILLWCALALPFGTASGANVPSAGDRPAPPGLVPTQAPRNEADDPASLQARGVQRSAAVGETLYIFNTNLENLSSPSNEDGFTHQDLSIKPTAWHIDNLLSCAGMGNAWWCGIVDSTWVFDPNRAGYDNDWTQYLENSVNLDGLPLGTPVTLGFRHKFDAEPGYDYGRVEVLDPDQTWQPLISFTGKVPNSGCDTVTVVIPDSIRTKYTGGVNVPFRFVFTSDVGYSSADGLYPGDGWVIDNITIKQGATVRFQDTGNSGNGSWYISTYPGVGDYWTIRQNVYTEDICTTNASKVWTAFDPVVLTLVPRMIDVLNTPPIATARANSVFMEFDVYRNLPVEGCFFYEPEYRTKNIGDLNWSLWSNPTNFVYYGGNKDWANQRIPLPAGGNKDSVQYRIGLKDLSASFCGGAGGYSNIYALFDNLKLGVISVAPPSIITRDIDLYQDTFKTTAFFPNSGDNVNTPLGDSTVVQVSASRGYKNGFLFYRLNGGSFSSVPLAQSTPVLPTFRYADVPAGNYPANTTVEYYFAVTDSTNATSYAPADAPTAQRYFSASILPIKTATNPALSCFDSLSTILFVNHFSGRETTPRIADALRGLGYKFDTWDVNGPTSGLGNALGGSTPATQYHWPVTDVNSLIQYKTIIWHSGDLSAFTITPEDEQVIQSWIQQSGKDRNFWIAGDDVAFELASGADYNNFLAFTCGARLGRDIWENVPQDTLHPIVTGVTGSPTAGRSFHLNGDCPIINHFDMVFQAAGAPSSGKSGILLKYPNTQPAATRYATKYTPTGLDSARAVFSGFNMNLIEEGGERYNLVKNIVNGYFKENACYTATAVEEDPATQAPRIHAELFQNSPNPFNPETKIRYTVASSGLVTLDIYSVSGARVRTLVQRAHSPGVYDVRWNGTDDAGRHLASGVYFYQLRTPGFTDSKKLILLK